MPESGGRLGTKLPAPAATTSTCAINCVPASVGSFQRRRHFIEMELRIERLHLFQKTVGEFLAGDNGKARNVVDGFFRIKLGALAARPIEDIHQMAFEVEQAQLEHREQADRAGADNGYICLNRRAQGYSHLNTWNGWGKRGPYMGAKMDFQAAR